jgi:hypothetical protein
VGIKTQIKKELIKLERYEVKQRSKFERGSVLLLVLATLFSVTELGAHSPQKQVARHDVVAQPSQVLNPAEKNETVRMPVKFDQGLRAVTTTGQ